MQYNNYIRGNTGYFPNMNIYNAYNGYNPMNLGYKNICANGLGQGNGFQDENINNSNNNNNNKKKLINVNSQILKNLED